jgi:hypothetical protein
LKLHGTWQLTRRQLELEFVRSIDDLDLAGRNLIAARDGLKNGPALEIGSSGKIVGRRVAGISNATRCGPTTAPGAGFIPIVVRVNFPSASTVPRASRPGFPAFRPVTAGSSTG